ncbi:hypothetical protein HDV06_001736 [Boothiomyces sp. JEL0866]|nr:hypothetical protein HDV06_001736 [Boothiomyces sp. JEL0866]
MDSVTLTSVGIITLTFILLVAEAGYLSRDVASFRIAPVFLFAQLVLCGTRAFTLLIELLIPGVNCVLLGNLGMAVYALWITCLDGVLLIRARTFLQFSASSRVRKVYTYVCIVQIGISLTIQLYVASTAFNLPFITPYCIIVANFNPQTFTLINRCVLYVLYAYPFVAKAYISIKDKNSDDGTGTDSKIWVKLGINNCIFTLAIIMIELVAAVVGNIQSLVNWLTLFFACVNFVESNILLLIVDNTKKQIQNNSNSNTKATTEMIKGKSAKELVTEKAKATILSPQQSRNSSGAPNSTDLRVKDIG